VQNADGKPENTAAGLQLLTLLTEQMSRWAIQSNSF
jgi:outer membrane protein assembly factor BamC